MSWEKFASQILRAEIKRRGFTYESLSARLQAMGVSETAQSIANKLHRGSFPFVFVLQCLAAVGSTVMHFDDIEAELARLRSPPSSRIDAGQTPQDR
jgi:hypothetical protein